MLIRWKTLDHLTKEVNPCLKTFETIPQQLLFSLEQTTIRHIASHKDCPEAICEFVYTKNGELWDSVFIQDENGVNMCIVKISELLSLDKETTFDPLVLKKFIEQKMRIGTVLQ